MINACLRLVALGCACALPCRMVRAQTEPTADQIYKNIQVLKGVPASTFMNTMFFQRYALGVSCSFCHVDAAWEKDDKPQKAKAREMLQMVLDLNTHNFGGKPAVNCMSCHNGSTKPQTTISGTRTSIQDMLGPRPAPSASRPNTAAVVQTIDQILDRYIAALGGADALAKVRNRVMKGNLITGEGSIVPFEDTYTVAPARSLSVRHFGSSLGDFATGFDGTAGWNSDNRGVTDQRGQFLAQLSMNAQFENRLDIRALYKDWIVTGTENIGTSPVVVVAATSSITGRGERLAFEISSGLLVRRSVVTQALFGSFSTDTYYENYRTIDGVTLPTMISEFSPDFGTVKKATSIEHNAAIDSAIFAKPPPRPPR